MSFFPFSLIEKLINEHGSATILRDRLQMAEDKHSSLDKKIADLNSEKKTLLLQLAQSEEEKRMLKNKNRRVFS